MSILRAPEQPGLGEHHCGEEEVGSNLHLSQTWILGQLGTGCRPSEDPGSHPHSILCSSFPPPPTTIYKVLGSKRESAFQVRSWVSAWRRCPLKWVLRGGKDCDQEKWRIEDVLDRDWGGPASSEPLSLEMGPCGYIGGRRETGSGQGPSRWNSFFLSGAGLGVPEFHQL